MKPALFSKASVMYTDRYTILAYRNEKSCCLKVVQAYH